MRKNSLFAIVIILMVAISCRKDFIVEDITDKSLIVLSPSNNLVTTSNQVTFWWEQLDGAEKYNLQIVKPNFTAITQIIVDTTVKSTKYTVSLQPGTYQWRIKAINNGGSTAYQVFNLKVDTTSDLSNLVVSIIDPANGYLTGSKRVSFNWNSLNSADKYQVVLLNASNGTIKDTTTALTTYTYSFSSQGAYSWKVRALNDFSISQYSSVTTFTIDLTSPTAPVITSPMNGAIITPSSSLSWNRVGAPDARYDSIFVASDSAFTNIISSTKTYSQSLQVNLLNTAPPANGSVYWWKLRSVDSVGNRSVYSNQQKFKLNP